MDSIYQTIVEQQLESYVVVTLVKASRSVPQEVGAKMLVTTDCASAPVMGTIGGGKVEKEAVEYAKLLLVKQQASELKFFHLSKDLEMACGGEVTLFFDVHLPQRWSIALFGAGHVCQHLVSLLLNLECQIDCFDIRKEWLDKLPSSPRIKKHLLLGDKENLDEFTHLVRDDAFCIVMTHGHLLDLPIALALLQAGKGKRYFGMIGSRSKAKLLANKLIASGASEEQVSKIYSPIGLSIGNNTPAEIAISIAAQLLEVRDKQ
jgi:xanthine dehydrogenase accessory factor